MTQQDSIRMAREAGFLQAYFAPELEAMLIARLERFAALVAADEREACAQVCEPKIPRPCDCEYCDCGNSTDRAAVVDWDASNALAAAIRARGTN